MVLCVSCPRQAVFNLPGKTTDWRCGTHKEPDMKNLAARKCKAEGCELQASYKLPGNPSDFCSIHKKEGYVYRNGTLNLCKSENCSVHATYGKEGSKIRMFCVKHREPDMVIVGHRICEHEQCSKTPTFGFEKPPGFCKAHKEPGMIDLLSKRCEHEGCMIKPIFNFLNETTGRFCKEHKLGDMVVIMRRFCQEPGCKTTAGFNYEGLKTKFCFFHKKEDMISVGKVRKCEKCDTQARFNFRNMKPARFCSVHKEPGMFSVHNMCSDQECIKHASFNFEGQTKRLFCIDHRKQGMINLGAKRCKSHMCDTTITDKYEGYCFRCYMHLFPDAPVTRRYKTKEMSVRDFLKKSFPDVPFIHDKKVECHLYRPDFVYDFGSHVVVIEVDEYQHESYDTSCDNKRLMSIFQGLGSRPMVMIRFNPDAYGDVKGCWTREGNLVNKGKPWRQRLEVLKDRLEHWFQTEPVREIVFEHLFFT